MFLFPLLLIFSVTLGLKLSLHEKLSPLTTELHRLCIDWVSSSPVSDRILSITAAASDTMTASTATMASDTMTSSASVRASASWDFIYRSLLCGESLPQGSFYESLKLLGLVHLMVVSGAHLIFFERILYRILFFISPSFSFLKKSLMFSLLILYAFCCLLKPPVVRALLSLSLSGLNHRFRWGLPGHQMTLLNGALCLALFPHWWTSYSLILSWGASLSLSLAKGFRREFFCFFLLYPLLLPIAPQNPVVLLSNWFFAPLFSCIMFPLSLFVSFVPYFRFFGDAIWSGVERGFFFFSLALPPLSEGVRIPLFYLWCYIGCLHFVIYFLKIYTKRKSLKGSL